MKTIFSIFLIINSSSVLAQQIYIPDPVFRNRLSTRHNIKCNSDNMVIYPADVTNLKTLDISRQTSEFATTVIKDLTGLEWFINLTTLYVQRNEIVKLDLTKNPKLQTVWCFENVTMDSINLTNNTALKILQAHRTALTSINLDKNTSLEELSIGYTKLKNLDLSKNLNLMRLQCQNIGLKKLNLKNNLLLNSVSCDFNKLDSLDLGGLPNITSVKCNNNLLTFLDVTDSEPMSEGLKNIQNILCSSNKLTYLDISTNYTQLKTLDISNNPSLKSIKVWTLPFPPNASMNYTATGTPVIFTLENVTPVELSSLKLFGSDLLWETKTETNNYGFEIQFSEDQSAWEILGFVLGFGTTTESKRYNFKVNAGKSGYVRLKQIDTDGSFSLTESLKYEEIPNSFLLSQNYPNPFNPSTAINYELSVMSDVKLIVFDMLGREVMTLVNESRLPGRYSASFNGALLTSGIYFYKLSAGSFSETKKMLLVK